MPGPMGGPMGGPGAKGSTQKAKDFKGTTKKLISQYMLKYKISLIIVLVFAILSTIFTIVGPKILGNATTEIYNGVISKLSGGSGTKDDPYTISGDKEQPTINTTLLNTRTIGEYVVFDEDGDTSTKELYRIVGIENGKVKLNKNDYIRNGTDVVYKRFSTSPTYGSGTSDDYWDYYLNNTWYNSLASKSMLDKGTYYINTVSSKASYKNSLCNSNNTTETTKDCVKTTSIWNTGYVGLPRYGEMFASQQESGKNNLSNIWLITPYSSSNVWIVNSLGYGDYYTPTLYANGARPSIFLKSNIVITGGSGTKSNPFTIALKD